MSCTEKENQGSGEHIDAVEMLTHGQGLAFQLRDLLLDDDDQTNQVSGDRLVLAEDLIDKIHGSFTNTIFALDRRYSAGSSDQIAESGESSGRPRSAPASRRRRREISESQSWTEISSGLVHDGYAWRKYGQKSILDAKHPRKYYKCTYKDQHGCPAKKHVQQISDDPLTYKTVYIFNHTCTSIISNAVLNASTTSAVAQPVDHMNHASSSTMILNFQSNHDHNSNHYNRYNNDLMNNQNTEDDNHVTPVQQMTFSNNNNNLGSLSDVGGIVMPEYMEDFMNNYSTDYSDPYISQPQDTEEWWFD